MSLSSPVTRPTVRSLILLGVLLAPSGVLAGPAEAPRRRFAIVVGANDGGPGRQLQYARSDAEGFAAVLRTLGGVATEDADVLLDPRPEDVRRALERTVQRLVQARGSASTLELVFYYSGHSDERGLFLGGQQLSYVELRALVRAAPAEFRVAILDSCASGSFTRAKGGASAPPFLIDGASRVTGDAVLTSSSATEASQESDRLKGSFFTHHLLSGLRGAADVTGDGKVTLNEAYQFAFHETLARTERTRAGAQHPAYDMMVAGTGDVVVTDLRGQAARLVLPGHLVGHVFLRDAAGRLVVELRKRPGAPVELGLEPGSYGVTILREGGVLLGGTVTLSEASTELDTRSFERLSPEQNPLRGEEQELLMAIRATERLWHWDLQLTMADMNARPLSAQVHGSGYEFPAFSVSYLFRPLRNDPGTPLDLQRFVQRPDELTVKAGLALTSLRVDPAVTLAGTFYPWRPLGLTAGVSFLRQADQGGLALQFGGGVSVFAADTLQLMAAYTNSLDLQTFNFVSSVPQDSTQRMTHTGELRVRWRARPWLLLEVGGDVALTDEENRSSSGRTFRRFVSFRPVVGGTFYVHRRLGLGLEVFLRSETSGHVGDLFWNDSRQWGALARGRWYILDWLSVGGAIGPIFTSYGVVPVTFYSEPTVWLTNVTGLLEFGARL